MLQITAEQARRQLFVVLDLIWMREAMQTSPQDGFVGCKMADTKGQVSAETSDN